MDVKKAIACAPLLPPPGGEAVKAMGEQYLALEKRCEEAERERDELKAENAMLRKQLDALKTMLKVEWNLLN